MFTLFQVAAFGTVPHPSDYVGALMIVMAVLGVVLGVVLEERMAKIIKCRYF